jgi:hypothetical protein
VAEPVTLGLIGGLVLAEGVKFLYEQANQILADRRAAKTRHRADQPGQGILRQPLDPGSTARKLASGTLELLGDLTRFLDPYVAGRLPVDPNDEDLIATADAVRRLLELAYNRDFTFVGEPQRDPAIRGEIEADEVAGYAAAVRLRVAGSPSVSGRARVGRVAPGGEVVGVDLERPPAN